jgi:hypothetical protein
VPVINGLTNEFHPCQILADIFTFIEHRGSIKGKVVAWVGDGNNMANTWLQAAEILGFTVHVSTPGGYEVDQAVAGIRSADSYKVFNAPAAGLRGRRPGDHRRLDQHGLEAENEARRRPSPTGAWTPRCASELVSRRTWPGGEALRRKHKPHQQRQRRGQRPLLRDQRPQLAATSSPVADSAYTVPSAPTTTSRAAMPGTSAMAICQLKPRGAKMTSSARPSWPARLYWMAGPRWPPRAAPDRWTETTAAPSAPG